MTAFPENLFRASCLRANLARWCGVAAAALAVGGCGGSATIKPAPLVEFKPSAQARVAWRTAVGEARPYLFTPALHSGAIYAASHEGRLVRLDAANGKAQWRVDTDHKLSGGVGVHDAMVLVGSEKGVVLAYGLDGKLLWSAQATSEVLSPPRAADGVVVVRAADGRILGLDAANGQRKWEHQFSLPPLLLRSDPGVTIARGLVLAGLPGGRVLALNLASGTPAWETVVAQPKGANEIERITDIGAAPLVDGDQACVVTYQGRIACVDLAKGALAWGRDASSAGGLATDADTLYMTDVRGAVMAFDKQSGATVWKQDKLLNRGVTGPCVLGELVAVGDLEGYVHFLSAETGAFVARLATDGSPVLSEPLRVGSGLVVQTREGGVYAISVK
jgi:outer membrane protein assembly factor BamB